MHLEELIEELRLGGEMEMQHAADRLVAAGQIERMLRLGHQGMEHAGRL